MSIGRLSQQARLRITSAFLIIGLIAFIGGGNATADFIGGGTATAEQIGPSFDCHAAKQPLAQMLCSDPDLSRTDLRFAQAYFALLRQVGEAGKRELKQEDLQFLEAVQRKCGIPTSGPSAPQSEASQNCVKSAYEAQRAVWVLRLTSPFSEEANRPIERHVSLQRLLQQLGFLPAEALINGVYGAATREAISQWQHSKNRDPIGVLADAEASALEEEVSSHGQRAEVIETLSGLPVPAQANQVSASNQLAAVQQEKSTVGTGNVTTITTRELDENSGKNLLEERLNKEHAAAIGWLGTFDSLPRLLQGDNWEKKLLGYESQSTLKTLQAAGLVVYTEEHRAPALPAMVTHVTIKPTPLIRSYVQEKDGYGWFKIPSPKYKIKELVKKDRYQGPVGEIAFLAGTLEVDVNPTYLTWAKAVDPNRIQGLAAQSKFRAVLIKDPVEDFWKISAIDIADKGSEFSSNQAELPPFGLTKVK